jgi:hypothetical protein
VGVVAVGVVVPVSGTPPLGPVDPVTQLSVVAEPALDPSISATALTAEHVTARTFTDAILGGAAETPPRRHPALP